MGDFTISGQTLFDADPQPTFLVREGRLAYQNPAAIRAFVEAGSPLEEGAVLPKWLCLPADSVSDLMVGGERWTIRTWLLEDGAQLYQRCDDGAKHGFDAQEAYYLSLGIKTTLNSLLASIERVQNSLVETELERHHDQLAMMNQSYYRLFHIADSLSLYSMMLMHPEELYQPELIDLTQFCLEMEHSLEIPVSQTGHKLTVDAGQKSLFVQGDRRLLERMVYQLCANGICAGGDVTLHLAQQGDSAVLTVTDSGSGIDPDRMSRLFQPNDVRVGPYPCGLGFGLSICNQIARLHGGRLMVTRLKTGTAVALSIPLAKGEGRSNRLSSTGQTFLRPGLSTFLVEFSGILPPACYDPDAL